MDMRIKDLSDASQMDDGTFFPGETLAGEQTRRVSGAQILDYILENVSSNTIKTWRDDVTLSPSTPYDIDLTASDIDARYCHVTVRDPANDYETVLMSTSAPDANTLRLDVGSITGGNFVVLIVEVP